MNITKKKLLPLSLLTLLFACENPSSHHAEEMILRSYQVPAAYAKDINSGLNGLLSAQPIKVHLSDSQGSKDEAIGYEKSHGRSRRISSSILSVRASQKIHDGIPSLIKQISESKYRPDSEVSLSVEAILEIAPGPHYKGDASKICRYKLGETSLNLLQTKHFATSGSFRIRGEIVEQPGMDDLFLRIFLGGRGWKFDLETNLKPGVKKLMAEQNIHRTPEPALNQCGYYSEENKNKLERHQEPLAKLRVFATASTQSSKKP